MITVFHNPKFVDLAFSRDIVADFQAAQMETSLEKVAEVQTEDLDEAYQDTNHIDRPWHDNESVTLIKKSRSTSIGDVMERNGERFIVDKIGFKRLP